MKTKKQLLFLLVLINSFLSQSQEIKPVKLFNLKEVNLQSSVIGFQQMPDLTPNQFSDFANISNFNVDKLANFQKLNSGLWGYNTASTKSIFLGFQIRESKNYVRIGFNVSNFTNIYTSFYKQIETSSLKNKFNSLSEYYKVSNSSKKLNLEASFTHKIQFLKVIESYIGLGISGGFAFDNSSEFDHSFLSYGYQLNNQIDTIYLEQINVTTSAYSISSKNKLCGSAFLPIGLSVRLSQNKKILNQISVYTEARPTYTILTFDNLKSQTYFQMQIGLGIRFSVL